MYLKKSIFNRSTVLTKKMHIAMVGVILEDTFHFHSHTEGNVLPKIVQAATCTCIVFILQSKLI